LKKAVIKIFLLTLQPFSSNDLLWPPNFLYAVNSWCQKFIQQQQQEHPAWQVCSEGVSSRDRHRCSHSGNCSYRHTASEASTLHAKCVPRQQVQLPSSHRLWWGCGGIAAVGTQCLCCQLLPAALTMHMVLCSMLCLLCTCVSICIPGEAARVRQQEVAVLAWTAVGLVTRSVC